MTHNDENHDKEKEETSLDRKVRDGIQRFEAAGANVTEVSVPMHMDGYHIWTSIIIDGAANQMIKGNGFGTSWYGHYVTSLMDAFARGWHSRPNDMSETVKLTETDSLRIAAC